MFEGNGKPLSEQGLQYAAVATGVGIPALWAVMTVETNGCGFLPDRRPRILFERHIFHRRTHGRFDQVAPDLSDSAPGGYGPAGAFQHERLARAIALDRQAALESASWGLGQIMGFNAAQSGFADVETMVGAMCDSEDAQFDAMMAFIRANHLAQYLQQGDWTEFASRYNGPSFKANSYDTKLSEASARFSAGPLPDLRVRAAQLYLTFLRFDPGVVDGWFGPTTQSALIRFQTDRGLERSGELDAVTYDALERAATVGAPVAQTSVEEPGWGKRLQDFLTGRWSRG